MKTMAEIVESIKNEAFTENNSGKLPKRVALLLALIMLTTMLASCDEFDKPGHGRPETTKNPAGQETENPEFPTYEYLEIEDFVGTPSKARDCGLRAFENFDFSGCFINGTFGQDLKNKVNYFLSDEYDLSSMSQEGLCSTLALWNYVGADHDRENVEIDFTYVFDSDWTHKIISTSDDFALVSKAPSGELFVTGFKDGKFKNELGLVNADSIKILKAVSSISTYNEILEYSRKEFFGQIAQQALGESLNVYAGAVMRDKYGNDIPIQDLECSINGITFFHANGGILAKSTVNEGISEDYIDQLLEQETIIEVSTGEDTEPERTRPVMDSYETEPPVISPDDVYPDYEEETTQPETEAEIDPEVSFNEEPSDEEVAE